MNTVWQRRVVWLTISLFIVVGLYYGFQPRPRIVDVAEVVRSPMLVTVEEEGKTRVTDRYSISAPITGTVCRTDLDVGDSVSRNDVLVTIQPLQSQALDPRSKATAEARVRAASATLRAAEQESRSAAANADLAATEYERLEPLARQGHISREELDRAAAHLRSTQALRRSASFSVDVASHELEAAQTALRFTGTGADFNPDEIVEVRAPVSGQVLKIQQQCEGVVDRGQPLLEIGDTRSLEIETDVLSADAVRIKPGIRAIYNHWGGSAPLEGQVRRVEPVGFTKVSALGVEEQRVLVISDITSAAEQWARVGDGYKVEASFVLWSADDVLRIPESALFRQDNGWQVFVLEDAKAKLREVNVGQRNGLTAQIISGLDAGELVITHPDDSIANGVSVRIR